MGSTFPIVGTEGEASEIHADISEQGFYEHARFITSDGVPVQSQPMASLSRPDSPVDTERLTDAYSPFSRPAPYDTMYNDECTKGRERRSRRSWSGGDAGTTSSEVGSQRTSGRLASFHYSRELHTPTHAPKSSWLAVNSAVDGDRSLGTTNVRPRAKSSGESQSLNRSLLSCGANSQSDILSSQALVPTTSTCGGGNRQRFPPRACHSQLIPRIVLDFPRPEAAADTENMKVISVKSHSNRKLINSDRWCNRTPKHSTHGLAPSSRYQKVRSAPSTQGSTIEQGDSREAERRKEDRGDGAFDPKSFGRATSPPGPPEHMPESPASTEALQKTVPIRGSTSVAAYIRCSSNYAARADRSGRFVSTANVLECEGVSDNTICLSAARPVTAPQSSCRPSSFDNRCCANRAGDHPCSTWETCDHLKNRHEMRNPMVNDKKGDCASGRCRTGADYGQVADWCDCTGHFDNRSEHHSIPRRPQSARIVRPPESEETKTWKHSSLLSPRAGKYRVPSRPSSARQRHVGTQRATSNTVDSNRTTTELLGVEVHGGAIRSPWDCAASAGDDVAAQRGNQELPSRQDVVRWGQEMDDMLRDRARKNEGGAMLTVNGREQFVDSNTRSGYPHNACIRRQG